MKFGWTCEFCNEKIISDDKEHHKIDTCGCGKTSVDFEKGYTRILVDKKGY